MANEDYLSILQKGVSHWNKWQRRYLDQHSDLSQIDLSEGSLRRIDLRQAYLRGVDLRGVDLRGVDLSQADLTGVDLSDADLRGAYLCGAYLCGANLVGANLVGANLGGAILRRADLTEAALLSTDLHDTDLSQSNLSQAYLRGADLRWANLTKANLTEAGLEGANLTKAVLSGANFTKAVLSGANFTEAYVSDTVFGNTNLSQAKGLEECGHQGSSIVDYRTLQVSGPLPEVFLRGCGLPDNLIDYLPSLLGEPFQFYSCFISYSSKNKDFAERLHADLQAKGVRCWFAPEDMKIGDKIRDRIDQAIRVHDKLLLILSEYSVDSDWVETEVETAFAKERREKQTVLFPVRLDGKVMKTPRSWAAEIRHTRHIGDFCQWKDHNAYLESFDRLLRDLKPELNKKTTETNGAI